MAINVSQAFHRTSANPVDESMALTKAQMLTVNDNLMPAYYFTICQDDGEIYLYDKTATPSSTTGKFTKFEGGGGGGGSTEGVVITKTLLASGWNSTTKQQTLTFNGYDADMGGVVGMPTNATSAQKQAYAEALIDVASQNGNVFTFQCEEIPSVDLPVTLYAGGGSGGGGADLPSGGTTGQALVKHSNADNDVEWATIESEQIQYSTMPTASATNVGQIVQFTGTTDATYTNGLFYECVNNSGTYSWVQKDVQSYPETDLTNVFASGFPTASVSGARPFSYSTDEKIVGTWIDGKPVYQKSLYRASFSARYDEAKTTIPNIKSVINVFGSVQVPGPNNTISYSTDKMIDATTATDKDICFWITTQSSDNFGFYLAGTGSPSNYKHATLTIQYTKTTD